MTNKKKRIFHSPEFKAEDLKLAEKVGLAAAARQLGLHESQIYASTDILACWCSCAETKLG